MDNVAIANKNMIETGLPLILYRWQGKFYSKFDDENEHKAVLAILQLVEETKWIKP